MSRREFLKRGIVGVVTSLALLITGCAEDGEQEGTEGGF